MRAVCIGELTVDWLSLKSGQDLMTATEFYRYPGGNAANVAIGLSRLGLESALVSSVGDDIHGQYLLDNLAKNKVDMTWIKIDKNYPTVQCYMTKLVDGSPIYRNWPLPHASQMLSQADLNDEMFEKSWLMHCSGVSMLLEPRRYFVSEAAKRAHHLKKLLSYDACFVPCDDHNAKIIAEEILATANIVKLNLSELKFWTNSSNEDSLEQMVSCLLKNVCPDILAITLAESGAMLYSSGESVFLEPTRVNSVGDIGPGDAFSAGLIYGLKKIFQGYPSKEDLKRLNLNQWYRAAKYASIAGALVTRAYGATEKFPYLEELESYAYEINSK